MISEGFASSWRTCFLMAAVLLLAQCSKPDETACTMEFRTIGLQVSGERIGRFYTLRLLNGDTLYHRYDSLLTGFYPVLDDAAMNWLRARTEAFRFEGWCGDSLVVTASFRLGADQCHIFKESGPDTWPQ